MTVATEFPTYSQLETDIAQELDLDISTTGFVTQAEMIKWVNKGIDKAEVIVHNSYQDYYLARDEITLVASTESYSAPSDIYAMKFRALIAYSGTDVYEVGQLRSFNKFLEYRRRAQNGDGSGSQYKYFILNETGGSWAMIFTPTPTTTPTIERWYYRQANRIVNTSDVLDIPEGRNYIMEFLRYRVILKQKHFNYADPAVMAAKADVEEEGRELAITLSKMVVDEDNEILPDLSIYQEHY